MCINLESDNLNKKTWIIILVLIAALYILYSKGLTSRILEVISGSDVREVVDVSEFDGTYDGWSYSVLPINSRYVTNYRAYDFTFEGGKLKFKWNLYTTYYYEQVDFKIMFYKPFNISTFQNQVYITVDWSSKIGAPRERLYVEAVALDKDLNKIYSSSWSSPGSEILITMPSETKYIGAILILRTFTGNYREGMLYLDRIALRYYVDASTVKFEVNLPIEDGVFVAPIHKVEIPIRLRNIVNEPISFQTVNYLIEVEDWSASGTVITDANGYSTINVGKAGATGLGSLKLWITYNGKYNEQFFDIRIKDAILVNIKGEDIQYYNEPLTLTLIFTDYLNETIDPERILITPEWEGGGIVTSSIEKESIGIYIWKAHVSREGKLIITCKGEKYNYISDEETFILTVKKPFITISHEIPNRVDVGETLTMAIKTLTPQKELIDPDEIKVSITDPMNIIHNPTISRVTKGVYAFTYTFNKQGLYLISIEAKESGFETGLIEVTVTASRIATPAGEVTAGVLGSPVMWGITLAGIMFSVFMFLKRRMKQ